MKLLSLSDTHEYIVLRTIHFYIHKTFTDDIQTMTELFKFKVENSRDFQMVFEQAICMRLDRWSVVNIFYYEALSFHLTLMEMFVMLTILKVFSKDFSQFSRLLNVHEA